MEKGASNDLLVLQKVCDDYFYHICPPVTIVFE